LIGRALRSLGCPLQYNEIWYLISAIDFDNDGKFDYDEFLKVVKQYHEKKFWIEYRTTGDPAEADAQPNSFDGFRASMKQHAGFQESELPGLRKCYDSFDTDGDGLIQVTELRHVLAECFKEFLTNYPARKKLEQIVTEIDGDKSGDLNFMEFLQLLRRAYDLREEEDFKREEAAMLQAELKSRDVVELRKMFDAVAVLQGGVRRLKFNELCELLPQLTDQKMSNLELRGLIIKRLKVASDDEVNFSTFLLIVRALLDYVKEPED